MTMPLLQSRTVPPRSAVLQAVWRRPGMDRGALGEAVGLSRQTVSDLVRQLEQDGLIEDAPGASAGPGSGSGRLPRVLRPVMPAMLVGGFDFGHEHLRVAIAQLDGRIRAERVLDMDVDHDAGTAIAAARTLFDQVLAEAGADASEVALAGASIPGPLVSSDATIPQSSILSGWSGLNPEREFRTAFGLDVEVFNDANLGALGELAYGAGAQFTDFVYIKAGAGIGAGIVIGGELYTGRNGLAGEIGHTPMDIDTALCRCGNTGCLEAVASASVVRAKLQYVLGPAVSRLDLSRVTDPVGQRVLADAGHAVGRVVADNCNLLSPQAVIVGGELGAAGEAFLSGVRESIARIALPVIAGSVEVMPAGLGRRSELLGAVAVAARGAVTRHLASLAPMTAA